MPELNKGFIPFAYVDANKKYTDEVGNDYDPHGWNTSKVMKLTNSTVTGSDETVYNIVKATINTAFSGNGYINGVWNNVIDGTDTGVYVPTNISNFTINCDLVNDSTKDSIFEENIKISALLIKGSSNIQNAYLDIKNNNTSILEERIPLTISDTGAVAIELDNTSDIAQIIKEQNLTYLNFDIIVQDEQEVIKSQKIEFVKPILFGSAFNNNTPNIITEIENDLNNIQRNKANIQSRIFSYNTKVTTLTPFFPEQNTTEYMFIAIPTEFGKITNIFKSAEYMICDEEWKPFNNVVINNIPHNLYVLQYRNQGTFEFRIKIEKNN